MTIMPFVATDTVITADGRKIVKGVTVVADDDQLVAADRVSGGTLLRRLEPHEVAPAVWNAGNLPPSAIGE